MIVDVKLTTPSLVEIIKNLGEQSNKAYLIIECADYTYPIIYHNSKYQELTQFSREEIERKSFQSIFLQKHDQQMVMEMQHHLQAGNLFEMELVQLKKQGTFCSQIQCLPFGTDYYLVLIEDITITQLISYMDQLEHQMFLSIEKNMKFHEQISLICSEIDEMFSPHSYTTITLKLENRLVTMLSNRFTTCKKKNFPITNAQELTLYTQVIQTNQILQIEGFEQYPINESLKLYLLPRQANNCWLIPIMNKGEVIGVMTVFFDVQKRTTQAYKQLMARLLEIIATCYELNEKQLLIQQLAYIDQSTSLPNLHHFKKTLKNLKKKGTHGVVKIVEASEFSKIVELYGRSVGDQLLKQLGERLKQTTTSKIFHIARYTSSSLIIFSTRDFSAVRVDPTPFLHITANPFDVNGTNTYITLKSGFAAFDQEVSCENSIRFAEVALEKAKKVAGTQTAYYEGHMDAARQREMQILNYLTEAIHQNEIETYFQPKMTLYRKRIASVEALARWHSKELGFVSPAEFIPVAENAGLICDIDLLMLEQILQWMQCRLYAGKKIIPVAINISPTHFYHPDFVMNVKRLLCEYYIDPNYLIVEVTESIGLADLKRAKMILRDLHRLGVKTSVDDFGIGYSSLSYLQKFSFQELKIDRSFTSNMHESGTFAIVKAIIEIAHTLQMTVTAEGVETKEQVEILQKLRCDLVQGYYYHRPMTIKNFEQLFDLE